MRKFDKSFMAALCGVVVWATTAHAGMIIDDFSVAQATISDGDASDSTGQTSTVVNPGIFGGDRDLSVIKTAGSLGPLISATVFSGSNALSIDRGQNVVGTAIIQWDGLSPPDTGGSNDGTVLNNLSFALAPQDLTQGGAEDGIVIQIAFAEPGQTIQLKLWGASAAISSTLALAVPVVNAGDPIYDLKFAFASFAGTASANAISAITLEATTISAAADMAIGTVATYAPEPTAVILLGLGLVPVWSEYRRRRRKQTNRGGTTDEGFKHHSLCGIANHAQVLRVTSILCIVAIGLGCVTAGSAYGALLGVSANPPESDITANNLAVSYDSTTSLFSASGPANSVAKFVGPGNVPNITIFDAPGASYLINVTVDSTGVPSGGFISILGKITSIGATSGTLLTGTLQPLAFGFQDSGSFFPNSMFDMIFDTTDGDLKDYFNPEIRVLLVGKGESSYSGNFDSSFSFSGGGSSDNFGNLVQTPEPSSGVLLFLGLAGVIRSYRQRKRVLNLSLQY